MSEKSLQQQQTLSYFDSHADNWQAKAEGQFEKVNVIAQRNGCALAVAGAYKGRGRLLDIGCGAGELVLEAAAMGIDATGVDFAPEMIRLCQEKQQSLGIKNAKFVTGSILDFEADAGSFDVISGLGLIEYMSLEEFDRLLGLCRRWLTPGGRLVLGSRNRLFNLFSINDFSLLELELGTFPGMMAEAAALAGAADTAGLFDKLGSLDADYRHPDEHPGTGIGVSRRLQFTPAALSQIVAKAGFAPDRLFGVHYHAMPPAVMRDHMAVHIAIANDVYQRMREDFRLVPQSSSFVMSMKLT